MRILTLLLAFYSITAAASADNTLFLYNENYVSSPKAQNTYQYKEQEIALDQSDASSFQAADKEDTLYNYEPECGTACTVGYSSLFILTMFAQPMPEEDIEFVLLPKR